MQIYIRSHRQRKRPTTHTHSATLSLGYPMSYIRVHLRVPAWAKGGDVIEATARGKVFKVRIPGHLRPGQYFQVRVPTSGESKEVKNQPAEVSWNLEPNIVVGNDKYFKEIKSCGEWLDVTRVCCPSVRFTSSTGQITVAHDCCCLPFCADFNISHTPKGGESKKIGTITKPGCLEQKATLILCPCLYTGPKIQAQFKDSNKNVRFQLRSEIKCCQYLCICFEICTPLIRCYRFCCTSDQYAKYEQPIYGPNVDNPKPVAKITYVDRMICPCVPDERLMMAIEPVDGDLKQEDLVLLSVFPTLISGYVTAEFLVPAAVTVSGFPTPTGISAIDDANNIEKRNMTIEEALQHRQQRQMN